MKILVPKAMFGLSLTVAMFLSQISSAQVPLSNGTYTQDFNSLASSGTSNPWEDNMTLPGWFAAKAKGSGAPTVATYRADNGGANAGTIYSYGVTDDANRALGSVGSGTPGTQFYGVAFTNDTSDAIVDITISYTGEQWRSGGPTVSFNTIAFAYRVATDATISDADVVDTTLWTPFQDLDFISPTLGAPAGALLGTDPTNQTMFVNVALTGVALQPGQALFIRWMDVDDSGSDHGLSIDDLSVSFTATPPVPMPARVIEQPADESVYLGDAASFNVLAGGDFPITYQWYSTNADGITLLTDATNSTLNLNFVSTNDASGYFCAVTNAVGGTNSDVAMLTVDLRTPIVTTIANLRTLLNSTNYAPTDTTNLYTVQGIVTTPSNMTGSTNAQFYMQDGSAGITVFISGGIGSLPYVGDKVEVTGPLGQFYGQLELNMSAFNPAHSISTISNGNPLPAPTELNLGNVGDPTYMKSIESSLVVVSNVFMQDGGTASFIASSIVNLTNLNNVVFPLYINPYVYDVIAYSIPPFASSITGVLAQHASGSVYTNGFQLVMTQYADLVSGVAPILPIPLMTDYSAGTLTLSWDDPSFTLQSSTNVAGPYADVPDAYSPFATNAAMSDVPAQFFRLYRAP